MKFKFLHICAELRMVGAKLHINAQNCSSCTKLHSNTQERVKKVLVPSLQYSN